MISCIDSAKTLNKIKWPFMVKILTQLGIKGKEMFILKDSTKTIIFLHIKMLQTISLDPRKDRIPIVTLYIQFCLNVSSEEVSNRI